MAKVFVTRREIVAGLGMTEWMFRRLREGGVLKPVEMQGYERGKYYMADDVAKALGVKVGWQAGERL